MMQSEHTFFCLVAELGIDVKINHKFPWLTNKVTHSDELLWEIFVDLGGYPEGMVNKRRLKLEPDGYLPKYNCIIEFDELQHFTTYRYKTLQKYPTDIKLGFEIDAYKSWCNEHAESALKKGPSGYREKKPEFEFKNGRAAQRALFDSCRDLLPHLHGLNPTIRVSQFDVPSILSNRAKAKEEVQAVLKKRL